MDTKQMMMAINDAVSNLKTNTKEVLDSATAKVQLDPIENNEEADQAFDIFYRLARHEVLSAQSSYIKKEFDESKKGLDDALDKMGINPEPIPGTTQELYHANGIKFSKRQNKNSTQVNTTDLLTQLARLGVEKAVVDKAVENATKEKRGNVYYIIEVD
tara:strand:- start:356 stop:832 length:477 start_codon:yes stop_codon:yes gene_type:complete